MEQYTTVADFHEDIDTNSCLSAICRDCQMLQESQEREAELKDSLTALLCIGAWASVCIAFTKYIVVPPVPMPASGSSTTTITRKPTSRRSTSANHSNINALTVAMT